MRECINALVREGRDKSFSGILEEYAREALKTSVVKN